MSTHPSPAQSAVLIALLVLSATCPPLAALFARGISRIVIGGYDAYLGGRPLPALTQTLVVEHAHSVIPLVTASLLALAIAAMGFASFRPSFRNTAQGHLLQAIVVFCGPFLGLVLVALTLIAAMMPLFSHGPIIWTTR